MYFKFVSWFFMALFVLLAAPKISCFLPLPALPRWKTVFYSRRFAVFFRLAKRLADCSKFNPVAQRLWQRCRGGA